MSHKSLPALSSDVMQQIYLCAINRYPNEACGFLVRTRGEKYRFMEARNVSEDPRNTFVMHAEDIIAAEDAGEVVAIWHSHVDQSAEASDADRAGCEVTEIPWLILAIRKSVDAEAPYHFSEMNVITPEGFEMPYLGRPYVFGVFDCWMLCRDYLKREFNVELNANAHLHIPSWYTGDDDILDQNYRNEGLVRLAPGTEPQRGDIALGIDTTGLSQFLVQADRFGLVNSVNGQITTPFVIENGVAYMNGAYIKDGTITNAKVGDLQSTNFVSGRSGWRLGKNGVLEINGSSGGYGRLVITGQRIDVYDDNNVLRVRLGQL